MSGQNQTSQQEFFEQLYHLKMYYGQKKIVELRSGLSNWDSRVIDWLNMISSDNDLIKFWATLTEGQEDILIALITTLQAA